MYKSIFEALPLPLSGDILGISGLKFWTGSPNYIPPKKIITDSAHVVQTEFPGVNVCKLPYPNNTYDYVICDQVIEHVEGNVQTAVNEMRRVLKPKGIAIITTGFMYPIHYGPKDLWRFSKDGLCYLCSDFSEVIECGSWGNRLALILFSLYRKFSDLEVPERKFSLTNYIATKNNEIYPLTTWIIIRK